MSVRRLDLWMLFFATTLVGCSSSSNSGLTGHHDKGDAAPGSGAMGSGAAGNEESGGAGGSGASGGDGASTGDSGGTGSLGGAGSLGGTAGAAGSIGKIPVGSTQCSDGKDNDGDGLVDSRDPECTGALDNAEGSFATGIPGDNVDPKWQDCFFDGNSGAGDDGCRYSTGCLTGALEPTDKDCQVTQDCVKYCKPLTPNGCDCFGCCEVTGADGGIAHVTIASTCTIADIGDPTKCPSCTPSTDCNNTCERCELCVGKSSIPADCGKGTGGSPSGGAGGAPSAGGAPAGGAGGSVPSGGAGGGYCAAPACGAGQQPCGVDCLPDCPQGQYCLTGCCIPSVR